MERWRRKEVREGFVWKAGGGEKEVGRGVEGRRVHGRRREGEGGGERERERGKGERKEKKEEKEREREEEKSERERERERQREKREEIKEKREREIGRASCGERVLRLVKVMVIAVV